ncbi:MBL fold metallo-hydrolase [Conexibacter sp. CPCC 206217]|uniref:MBL fold metallo-hydrolase n=1 Tax=Conexibacter sp. CPCC 206217 TaxID=3064574 RepID=UPI002728C088|nr:MBL fold metallo-hydrolase [Conexibacter sp. CPCC 206217]MDO8213490.1 MBL fold metallo-hydrolase [Conexibacter sp. CPCC 206217]
MQVEWHGQSAFRLSEGDTTVFVDPFGDMSAAAARGIRWEYPPISGVGADVLIVTHEHSDHTGVEGISGDPVTVRSTPGRHETPIGEVVAIASEHDDAAGTERGANTLVAFTLGGVRVAHLGDLGQRALRPEQARALGTVDLLFVPVGGGPTIGAETATRIAALTGARVIVPMHYRTERISFLDPVDGFVERSQRVERLSGSTFELDALPGGDGPLVVVPAAP